MTAETRTSTGTLRVLALISGISGIVSGALFVTFFAGYRSGHLGWAGAANDVVGIVATVTLGPVAWGLLRRMPESRTLRISAGAVVVLTAVAGLHQLLIFAGWSPLPDNIVVGAIATYAIFVWILLVSLAGHRTRTLPRPVTRVGLLIGPAFPAGVVLILPGLVTPDPVRWVFLGAGIGVGVLAYLAIPVFPLVLAKHVFKEE
jgi:hypothetical protein